VSDESSLDRASASDDQHVVGAVANRIFDTAAIHSRIQAVEQGSTFFDIP
jgi:hypothetical protein